MKKYFEINFKPTPLRPSWTVQVACQRPWAGVQPVPRQHICLPCQRVWPGAQPVPRQHTSPAASTWYAPEELSRLRGRQKTSPHGNVHAISNESRASPGDTGYDTRATCQVCKFLALHVCDPLVYFALRPDPGTLHSEADATWQRIARRAGTNPIA